MHASMSLPIPGVCRDFFSSFDCNGNHVVGDWPFHCIHSAGLCDLLQASRVREEFIRAKYERRVWARAAAPQAQAQPSAAPVAVAAAAPVVAASSRAQEATSLFAGLNLGAPVASASVSAPAAAKAPTQSAASSAAPSAAARPTRSHAASPWVRKAGESVTPAAAQSSGDQVGARTHNFLDLMCNFGAFS